MSSNHQFNAYLSRPVHRKSIPELGLRNDIAKRTRIPKDARLHTIPNEYLHHTVGATITELNVAMDAIKYCRVSQESTTANVVGLRRLGRSRKKNRVSYAIEIEPTDVMEEEVEYYQEAIGLIVPRNRIPHVTLLQSYDIPHTIEEKLANRIEQRLPSQITLGAMAIRLSSARTRSR